MQTAAMTSQVSKPMVPQRSCGGALSSSIRSSVPAVHTRRMVIAAAERGNLDEDSYQKIEAPVRGEKAMGDQGPPMRERETELDREIVTSAGNREKDILGTEVSIADSMRFKGALPEIANCRLSMLGFVAALGYEIVKGQSVAAQFKQAPGAIALTFLIIIVASAVPVLRGVPRRNSEDMGGIPGFSSDAEVLFGRTAMIGFLGLVITEALKGGPLVG